ncbi:hypothetical protein O0535_07970 [Brevibacillus halotolerans]|uniref:Uncharacterized protein n=2 Tax=Brevibacillus TaxID=55080 RepID=A0A0F7C1Q4_BRELA|nr:hypothetical protein EX87_21645 [Brevibacillus laterosporus]MCZ0830724.1 hypothetical protein [Brevibacillus halotolerans]GIN99655.1 hypothetical protein J5TS2_03240 [Brevibacillus halotolerans]
MEAFLSAARDGLNRDQRSRPTEGIISVGFFFLQKGNKKVLESCNISQISPSKLMKQAKINGYIQAEELIE